MRNKILLILAIFLGSTMIAFAGSKTSSTPKTDKKISKDFKDFTINDSDGKTVKFSDYVAKGKYVLVDFWASWCLPCRREIANLVKVNNKFKGEDFIVLGVAVWDAPEDSKQAIKDLGVNYDVIINAQKIPTQLYKITGIPEIMLFGPDGAILEKGLRGDQIEKAVAKYVKAKQ